MLRDLFLPFAVQSEWQSQTRRGKQMKDLDVALKDYAKECDWPCHKKQDMKEKMSIGENIYGKEGDSDGQVK